MTKNREISFTSGFPDNVELAILENYKFKLAENYFSKNNKCEMALIQNSGGCYMLVIRTAP